MAMKLVRFCRALSLLAALAIAGALAAPKPAQAHVHFGFFVGPSIIVGPPIYDYYDPAPVYYDYDPPPAYYPATPAPAGYTCYAGPYVCPLTQLHPVGGPCACPAYGGTSATGTVR